MPGLEPAIRQARKALIQLQGHFEVAEKKRVKQRQVLGKLGMIGRVRRTATNGNCYGLANLIPTLADSENLNLVRKSGLRNSELRCRAV
jgi:hypothetical protein